MGDGDLMDGSAVGPCRPTLEELAKERGTLALTLCKAQSNFPETAELPRAMVHLVDAEDRLAMGVDVKATHAGEREGSEDGVGAV